MPRITSGLSLGAIRTSGLKLIDSHVKYMGNRISVIQVKSSLLLAA